jgi:hypothetical protein
MHLVGACSSRRRGGRKEDPLNNYIYISSSQKVKKKKMMNALQSPPFGLMSGRNLGYYLTPLSLAA